MRSIALVAVLIMGATTLVMAQSGTAPDSTRARLSQPSAASPGGEEGPGRGANQAPYKMPPLGKALLDDLHNKVIHFPIVLTLVAAAMLIVARKKPQYEPVAFWLVWLAALSVIPAYFSGKAVVGHFEHRPKEWLAEIHEKQGIIIGITEAFWVLSLLRVGTRRWAWLIGLLLSTMVIGSGFTGGLLAHGH
jgi:uncharacterized membrane protein